MDVDDFALSSSPATDVPDTKKHEQEIVALHHSAFESLRRSTLSDEQAFLGRMRTWEANAAAEATQVQGGCGAIAPNCSPAASAGSGGDETIKSGLVARLRNEEQQAAADASTMDEENGDESEDDIDFVLVGASAAPTPGVEPIPLSASSNAHPPHQGQSSSIRFDVDELSVRLKGDVTLDDYSAVREWQARLRRTTPLMS